jgi:hypothetical protein
LWLILLLDLLIRETIGISRAGYLIAITRRSNEGDRKDKEANQQGSKHKDALFVLNVKVKEMIPHMR